MNTLSENIIAENLLYQVDEEFWMKIILNNVVNQYFGPDDILMKYIHNMNRNGLKKFKCMTCVWEVCLQCKYGSTYFISKKCIKD